MYYVFLKICSIEIYYSLTILPFSVVQYKLKAALLYIPHINKGDDWLKSYLVICAFTEVLKHLIFHILPEFAPADIFQYRQMFRKCVIIHQWCMCDSCASHLCKLEGLHRLWTVSNYNKHSDQYMLHIFLMLTDSALNSHHIGFIITSCTQNCKHALFFKWQWSPNKSEDWKPTHFMEWHFAC